MSFPSNFTWGAATASYQVEGAAAEDGRGRSIWDAFTAWSGKVYNGDTGLTACDHYHRFSEDVGLMKDLGLQAYRFSVAWPRIIPSGSGQVNQKGLDFYSRLVDSVLEAGIEPWLTLYHWDLPEELQLRGGWMNPDIADRFAEYTSAVASVLGDRVNHWMTFNEPQCFLGLGTLEGVHAPGWKLSRPDFIKSVHNSLVAHGRSVDALRAAGGDRFKIGYVPTTQAAIPDQKTESNIEAARRAFFSHTPHRPLMWTVSLFTDPVFLGSYAPDILAEVEGELPRGWERDLPLIGRKIDFCGINLYSGYRVGVDSAGNPTKVPEAPGYPKTAIKWNVEPETLRWGPRFLYERYKKPVVITENGLSLSDWVSLDGAVHDPARIDFTRRYLLELEKAVDDGADIAAYFHWSFLDNFEWAQGYSERFGLVHVDYGTQKRTIKDSGRWYREVIETNGERLRRD